MIDRILLMLRARKFVGHVVVIETADACPGVAVERVDLVGIEGRTADGDLRLIPWGSVISITHGAATADEYANRVSSLDEHKRTCPSCGDGHKAPGLPDAEIEALLRAFPDAPSPAEA